MTCDLFIILYNILCNRALVIE